MNFEIELNFVLAIVESYLPILQASSNSFLCQ